MLGDAGDLSAQLFQRAGVDLVAAGEPSLHHAGHARHFSADLLDCVGRAVFDVLHTAPEGVGHAQDLVSHAFNGVRRAALGLLHLGGHLDQRPFDALETAIRGFAEVLRHLGAHGVDPGRQADGELFQARFRDAARGAGLGGAEAFVELSEGGAQLAHGLGGARLGFTQALGQPMGEVFSTNGIAAGGELRLHRLDIAPQLGEALLGLGVAVVEVTRDLREGVFHRADGFHRATARRFLLDPAQALVHATVLTGKVGDGAFEARGDRGLLALRLLEAAEDAVDR